MQRPIYFDTAATTPLDPEVCAAMFAVLNGEEAFANPSSAEHEPGLQTAARIATARASVAEELDCEADEVLFTSGATESINLALRGIMDAVALRAPAQPRHIVTTAIEHKATLACCAALEEMGTAVTYLDPAADGRICPQAVRDALRPETLLISLIDTNNEVGTTQPVAEVAAIAAEHGVVLHVDAAQAAGKRAIDVAASGIDLLSFSAHKFHGPKGVGVLVVRDRPRLPLRPLCYGGGQEFGLRPGTLPTHQIVGLARALELAAVHRPTDLHHVTELRQRLLAQLREFNPQPSIHTNLQHSSPYILNFSIPGISSAALINQTRDQIAIASGSACAAGAIDPSPVLRAMGVDDDALYGAVRISFSRQHSAADIDFAAAAIAAAVDRIRRMGTD
ncbi:cysteine desulfurase [Halorhodospira abdelmalekii]|uniref:cysteine desulfurase family protein n=1 Tax=Halorhodospira abdelmalekii TaxID=421629 RepID=UPI001908FCF4|nr:cysteine desulfurase family protein [Halorhodospira abdelmalekii]MBK1735428.1 cysteine desulfurase [Halorhodospira abdelmalekii]